MPAAEDGIFINHGHTLTFAQEMMDETNRIAGVINDLQGELAPIVNQWLGPDRDVYFGKVQPTWNAEVHALATILQSHATTLNDVSDQYKQTVYQNAQGFEEIKF